MKNLSLKSKKELIQLLYNVLQIWSIHTRYVMPSYRWLYEYTICFHNVASYPTVYGGREVSALGTCSVYDKTITVASDRDMYSVINTVVHELAHAVQQYNYRDDFGELYTAEANHNEHKDNRFECEARLAEEVFCGKFYGDRHFERCMKQFEPSYEHPCKESSECWEYFWQDIKYYNDPNISVNRKKWWLRV